MDIGGTTENLGLVRRQWSTDQLANLLACSRGNTSRKIEDLRHWIATVIAPGVSDLRSDRATRSICERITALGKLASADPEGFRRFIRAEIEDFSREMKR